MKRKKIEKIQEFCRNILKNDLILVFYVISNVINGVLLRIFTLNTFKLRPLLFDLSFVLFLLALSFLVKKKKRNIYYFLTSLFMVIVCIVNAIYHNYYDSFVSFSLLATSVFVKDVGEAVVDFAIKSCDWIYLWNLVGLLILFKKKNCNYNVSKKKCLKTLYFFIAVLAIGCAFPPYNSFSRLVKMWNRVAVVDSFGGYIYQVDDLIQSLKPTFNNLFGHDKALKETKDYYDKNKASQTTNDYTKIFEGKNVIVIHAESLQAFNMELSFEGKEVTPNINRLASEGIFFSNFYAQVGVGTSSDSEFTYASSLLPAKNGTVFVNYFNNKYETIQNSLNNKGYYVFSMHGNDGDFWNRDTMHLNMGYDKFYSKSSFIIDEEYGLGLSDKSFFRQVVPMISEIKAVVGEPYYGTLITLTNHTPWRDPEAYSDYRVTKSISIDGERVTRDYLEGRALGRYIKSVNYMDQAIGQFIDEMDENGLLDNTVIVIYGDHDARLSKNEYEYIYNYDPITDRVLTEDDPDYVEYNEYDYELDRRVPFIIWTKDQKFNINCDTPMGMIDASVTLGNMLGVYNKYALGKDIMDISRDEGIVVFKDGSYITDKIYYSSKNNEAYSLTGGTIISEDYIRKNSEYADKIIQISDDIITYDLLKELK